jgi:periplasmic protein TonB
MFLPLTTTGGLRWRTALVCSLALHAVVLVLLHPRATFLKVQAVSRGSGDKTYGITDLVAADAPAEVSRTLYAPRKDVPAAPRPTRRNSKSQGEKRGRPGDTSDKLARAGSPWGSLYEAMAAGREVRPALPTVFPDPPVDRFGLAPEIQGDVIVEVTIDVLGQVIDTKLLSGVGHGIDETVVSTLKSWHFRPATIDGVPIPSKQDVHFHFPA